MTSERPCRRTDTRIWRRYDGGGGGKDETIRTRHDPDRQQVEVLSGGELEGVDIDRIRVTTARGLLAVVVLVPKEVCRAWHRVASSNQHAVHMATSRSVWQLGCAGVRRGRERCDRWF